MMAEPATPMTTTTGVDVSAEPMSVQQFEQHPVGKAICDLRLRRVAADFSPEQSGQRGQDYDRGLLEAAEAVRLALTQPEPDKMLGIVEAAIDDEAVERGAKAMWLVGQDWNGRATWSDVPEYGRDYERDRARACLCAALNPEGSEEKAR